MTASTVARRRRRRKKGSTRPQQGGRGKGLIALASTMVLLVVLVAVTAGSGCTYGKTKYDDFVSGVVPPEQLIGELPRGGARIYDRNGTLLYEFIDELSGLRRPVPLDEISDFLIDATVATEDADYWTNNGLNIRGLARAAYENFSPFGGVVFEGSGGSSLTQQLAKNVYIPREERADRSVERKLKEAAIAVELTNLYSKEQILEWYLNSISYGSIYVGVEAAAQGYFDKAASDLTLAESALLAGIPQQPALYDPFLNLDADGDLTGAAKVRQRSVLNAMVRTGYITSEEANTAAIEDIEFKTGRYDIEAAHFVLGRVASEIRTRFGERALFDDGLEVTTSLDLTLQKEAESIVEHWVSEFEEQSDGHNGAMLALDTHTGQILVYVGSRDYFRNDIEGRNDNVISQNSPGSTLKPFTYMTAFMQGWSTGTGIIDAPFQIVDAATGEPFAPRNPIKEFQGVITAEKALGNSLNIPAFKAILSAGVENTVSVLKGIGFTTLDNPLGYGPALTLGGVDVTLEDIVFAYSVFANEGIMRGQQVVTPYDPGERNLEPVALLRVTDADGDVLYDFTVANERRVIASNFSYLVTSILSNGENQCITYGVCNALALPGRASAAKTGTSEPFDYEEGKELREIGDTWALGFTPDLVAGVWAGNSDNSPMVNILSTSISWHSWRDFMVFAHDYLAIEPSKFVRPATGIVERELCWPSGRLPTDLCPNINRYTGLFADDVLPRDQESLSALQDSWWQLVRIDTRTGLLAAPTAPAAFVTEEVRLVLPRDEIYLKDRDGEETGVWEGLAEWAERQGISALLAPTEEATTAGALLRVVSPVATQTVSGLLPVIGRAASDDFVSYAVEWARAAAPGVWIRHWSGERPVENGVLATWDTRTVPNGDYLIRTVLRDSKRGMLRFEIPIVIDNGEDGADVDLAPWGQLISPPAGSTVSGQVWIEASAVSGAMQNAVIEVGSGIAPGQWTELAQMTNSTVNQRLAVWDTVEVPDGTYTLRLTVTDTRLGSIELKSIVTVKNEVDE